MLIVPLVFLLTIVKVKGNQVISTKLQVQTVHFLFMLHLNLQPFSYAYSPFPFETSSSYFFFFPPGYLSRCLG